MSRKKLEHALYRAVEDLPRPGLDAVSFGPQMHDIHTSRERLDIASTARTWEYLVAVLERL